MGAVESLLRSMQVLGPFFVVAFACLAVGQAAHACAVAARYRRSLRGEVVYEAVLAVHLAMVADVCPLIVNVCRTDVAAIDWWGAGYLWANVPIALFALVLAVIRRNPRTLADAVFVLVPTPAAYWAAGEWWPAVLMLDGMYFCARVVAHLMLDRYRRRGTLTRGTFAEAIRALPEGVLLASRDGKTLFMNDAMRSSLVSLGLATDLCDARVRDVWGELTRAAQSGALSDPVLPHGLLIEVEEGRVRYFTCDDTSVAGVACTCVVAVDVTELEQVADQVATANRRLAFAGEELRASMGNVAKLARDEALVAMRAKVHDVVGQRLSILHRYLEDGAPASSFDQVAELLSGVMDELLAPGSPDARTSLAAVVDAFLLAGVEVRVDGVLPEDPAVAETFVRIVREACTNAVRHGRVRDVEVQMERADDGYRLVVRNGLAAGEGVPSSGGGKGIPGMRAAAEALGGRLDVFDSAPFTLVAWVPEQQRERSTLD